MQVHNDHHQKHAIVPASQAEVFAYLGPQDRLRGVICPWICALAWARVWTDWCAHPDRGLPS